MFSKKHYEFLAHFLKYEISVSDDTPCNRAATIQGIARLLTLVLQNDNPRFNREQFLKACGIV